MCSSPRLIAAYHDLHRLSMPRHPPCALLRLISSCSRRPAHAMRLGLLGVDLRVPDATRLAAHRVLTPSGVSIVKEQKKRKASRRCPECGRLLRTFRTEGPYSSLQKGGDPAAPSGTATLLRLRPNHQSHLRRLPPCGWHTGFGSSQLPWRDGRCVQGPGTYSPWHG